MKKIKFFHKYHNTFNYKYWISILKKKCNFDICELCTLFLQSIVIVVGNMWKRKMAKEKKLGVKSKQNQVGEKPRNKLKWKTVVLMDEWTNEWTNDWTNELTAN